LDWHIAVHSRPTRRSGAGRYPGRPGTGRHCASQRPADVDTRSDVYALGWCCTRICDATPFDPGQFSLDSVEQLRRQFAEYAPIAPSERLLSAGQARRARQTRGDLDAVVAKAMQAERTQRYESVSDLIDDLRRFLDQRPLSARPASRRHRLQLYLGRNRCRSAWHPHSR
jgi:non-specific serine/threonine protein kinase/serine/threonine-protein kinase